MKLIKTFKRAVSLGVKISSLNFKNPILPAAGPPVQDSTSIINCIESGVGGIVAKTVSSLPAEVPRPCMIKIGDNSMLNHELHSDKTYEEMINEFAIVREKFPNVPFIGSIGYSKNDIELLAEKLVVEGGVDALEISIHHNDIDINDPEMVGFMVSLVEIAKKVSKGNVPIFPKISPGITSSAKLKNFAIEAEKAGADGIVAINSLGPCLSIDINTGYGVTGGSNGYGWLSGEAIKSISLRYVYEISGAVNIPVFGVGGVQNGLDAIEMMMAGASGVQVCTAAILNGPKVFKKIIKEMEGFMEEKGISSVDDIIGLSRKITSGDSNLIKRVPKLNKEYCNTCGTCKKHCPYNAIEWIKEGDRKFPNITESLCYGCGLCTSYCPEKALSIRFW